jgi:hypothetical protein
VCCAWIHDKTPGIIRTYVRPTVYLFSSFSLRKVTRLELSGEEGIAWPRIGDRMQHPIMCVHHGEVDSAERAMRKASREVVESLAKACRTEGLTNSDRALLVRTQHLFARIGGLSPRDLLEGQPSSPRRDIRAPD